MKSPYLYVFGYESPSDYVANLATDGDTESTGVFRISAESEDSALKWGWILSKWYVDALFGEQSKMKWDEHNYACWIERSADDDLLKLAEKIPVLTEGSFPVLENVRNAFSDDRTHTSGPLRIRD